MGFLRFTAAFVRIAACNNIDSVASHTRHDSDGRKYYFDIILEYSLQVVACDRSK